MTIAGTDLLSFDLFNFAIARGPRALYADDEAGSGVFCRCCNLVLLLGVMSTKTKHFLLEFHNKSIFALNLPPFELESMISE
jgi:hypothetical protein